MTKISDVEQLVRPTSKNPYPLFEWAPDGKNIIIRDIEVIQMIIDHEYDRGNFDEAKRLLRILVGENALK